jgi:hypothetical protein
MNSILLKLNKYLKKIAVIRSYSAVNLGHLISHTFQLKDKIVGLTHKIVNSTIWTASHAT